MICNLSEEVKFRQFTDTSKKSLNHAFPTYSLMTEFPESLSHSRVLDAADPGSEDAEGAGQVGA